MRTHTSESRAQTSDSEACAHTQRDQARVLTRTREQAEGVAHPVHATSCSNPAPPSSAPFVALSRRAFSLLTGRGAGAGWDTSGGGQYSGFASSLISEAGCHPPRLRQYQPLHIADANEQHTLQMQTRQQQNKKRRRKRKKKTKKKTNKQRREHLLFASGNSGKELACALSRVLSPRVRAALCSIQPQSLDFDPRVHILLCPLHLPHPHPPSVPFPCAYHRAMRVPASGTKLRGHDRIARRRGLGGT
eukprot:1706167-Rhodomonas_salina.2